MKHPRTDEHVAAVITPDNMDTIIMRAINCKDISAIAKLLWYSSVLTSCRASKKNFK
jgi:hypothetical protein